jgi:hypothetical protein
MKFTLTRTAVSTLALLASLASAQPSENAGLISEPPGTPSAQGSATGGASSNLLAEPPAASASAAGTPAPSDGTKADGPGNAMPGVSGPGVIGPGMGPGPLGADPPEPRAARASASEGGERDSAGSGSDDSQGMRDGKERGRSGDFRMKGDAMGARAMDACGMGQHGPGQHGMHHQAMHHQAKSPHGMHHHAQSCCGMPGHDRYAHGFHPHGMHGMPSQNMPSHAMSHRGMPSCSTEGHGMSHGMGHGMKHGADHGIAHGMTHGMRMDLDTDFGGMAPGRFGGHGDGSGMGGQGLERLVSLLELDDMQVDQLETIHDDMRKKRWEIAGRMIDAKIALRRAWRHSGEQRDREAILGAYRRLGELHLESLESKFDGADRVEKVLNEEQRQKLLRFGPRWMTVFMDGEE